MRVARHLHAPLFFAKSWRSMSFSIIDEIYVAAKPFNALPSLAESQIRILEVTLARRMRNPLGTCTATSICRTPSCSPLALMSSFLFLFSPG